MLFYQKLVEVVVLHQQKVERGKLGSSDPGHLVYEVRLPVCFRFASLSHCSVSRHLLGTDFRNLARLRVAGRRESRGKSLCILRSSSISSWEEPLDDQSNFTEVSSNALNYVLGIWQDLFHLPGWA